MLAETDYYAVLQVDPRAESDVIHAAYRVLARRCHPDVAGGSDERMAALNIAWTVLRDPEARAAYDQARAPQTPAGPARAHEDATTRPNPPPGGASGSVLEFGRYAGWSLGELARHDPDFLEWLARTPIGRRYQSEIAALLAAATPRSMPLRDQNRHRASRRRRFAGIGR